jgi:DNA-binding PadR family transcriptional regulator
VILELLAARADRMYGLELVAESGGRLKRGSVYVVLGRMQEKGYVEADKEKHADDSGLVPRRMYRATALGLRVLRAWIVAAESLAWEAGS